MVIKLSSKNQITIPKSIADAFTLQKGDFLEIKIIGDKIMITPKEIIFENKYPRGDLEGAEKKLEKNLSKDEISFNSSRDMVKHLKKRIKK